MIASERFDFLLTFVVKHFQNKIWIALLICKRADEECFPVLMRFHTMNFTDHNARHHSKFAYKLRNRYDFTITTSPNLVDYRFIGASIPAKQRYNNK